MSRWTLSGPKQTKFNKNTVHSKMASVRPGLSRKVSSKTSFASISSRDVANLQMSRRGFQIIQETLESTPNCDESIQQIPRTSAERTAREQQRIQERDERKAWRKARLETITNQWADNRMENSSLKQPRRASWMRRDDIDDIEDKKYFTLCCGCFG